VAIEKPLDDATLDVLERIVSNRDTMRPYKKRIPVATSSNKSAKDILNKMGAVQTNRTILEILGAAEEAQKARPGLVSAFLDPQKGSLFAPARFGSAFLADVLGLGENSKAGAKLRSYNPLESAVRSASGEFAVTGGDIIPVRDSDNLVERGGKLIGALAWDILTDPTSYVGGPSALSRKGVIETAVTQANMRRFLDTVRVKALKEGFDSRYVDDIVEKLASQNRRFAIGDIVPREILDNAGNPTGLRKLVRASDGAEIGADELLDIAAYELSSTMSENYFQFGASGAYDYLTEILSSERFGQKSLDFADKIFQTDLPRELVGGLYVINPLTGKRLVRIAGGKGRSNAAKDFVNKARFTTARGTRMVPRELSGESGPIWAQALEDMHPAQRALKGSTRTTFGEYLKYKEVARKSGSLVDELNTGAVNTVKTIIRGRQDLEKRLGADAAKLYDQNVTEAAWRAGSLSDEQRAEIIGRNTASMTSDELAIHMADRHGLAINGVFREMAAELQKYGIDIPLQKNFLPLFYSQNALKYLRKYEPRQGVDLRDFYSGEISRETFESPMTQEELAKFLQVDVSDVDKLFASPVEANKRARELYGVDGMFETDVTRLISRYSNWASHRIASQVSVDVMRRFGVLIKVDDIVTRTINANNAQAFIDAAEGLSSVVRKRLQEVVDNDAQALRAAASEDSITKENVRRKAVLKDAQTKLNDILNEEQRLLEELRDANSVIRRTALTDEKYVANLRRELTRGTAAEQGKAAVLTSKIRNLQKVFDRYEARIATTKKSLAGYKARKTRLENIIAGPKTKTVIDPTTGAKKRVKIARPSDEDLTKVTAQLEELNAQIEQLELDLQFTSIDLVEMFDTREAMREFVSDVQDINVQSVIEQRLRPFVEAIDTVRTKSEELVRVRALKKEARANLKTARIDSRVLRAKEVNKRIEAYIAASEKLTQFSVSIRGVKKEALTAKQAKRLEYLKNSQKVALKKLEEAIGWTANRKTTRVTAGREFARELRKHVKNLTANNARMLTVFADPELLEQFTKRVVDSSLSHDERMEAFGALFKSYRSIRRFVTDEDLSKLTELQRRLYNPAPGVKESVIEEVTGPYTAQYSKLRSDLAAAERRNDGKAVAELTAQIRKVEMLADKDMFSLVGAGKNIRVPRAYENVYGSLGIRRVLERIHQVQNDPNEWEQIIRGVYDPLLFVWKTQATVGRGPAYVINNLVSAFANNYLGNVTVADHWQSARLLGALDSAQDKAKKFMQTQAEYDYNVYADKVTEELSKELKQLSARYNVDMEEFFMDFMESPAWWSTESVFTLEELAQGGLVANPTKLTDGDEILGVNFKFRVDPDKELSVGMKRFRKGVNILLTNPMQRKFNSWAQKSEVYVRLAAYIHGRKQFGNHESALNLVYALHFDYRDLGQAEQWVKRLAPFYTWNRYNIPLQLRAMFFQTDKIKNLVRINENFEEYFGADSDSSWMEDVMPEWFDVQGGWVSRFGFAGRPLAFTSRLPIYDLDKTLQVHMVEGIPVMVSPRRDAVAQLLGPGVTPLEWIGNVNFDTGRPFKDDREKLFRLLTGLVPVAYTGKRFISATTLPLELAGVNVNLPLIDESRNASDAINLLLGAPFSAQTVSESSLTSGLMGTAEAQVAQITELAAKANVDVDWLRKMIRRGLTVQQIKTLVQNGYGKADLLAREKALRAEVREPNRDYGQVLDAFISGNPNVTGYPPQ